MGDTPKPQRDWYKHLSADGRLAEMKTWPPRMREEFKRLHALGHPLLSAFVLTIEWEYRRSEEETAARHTEAIKGKQWGGGL